MHKTEDEKYPDGLHASAVYIRLTLHYPMMQQSKLNQIKIAEIFKAGVRFEM